MSAEVQPPTRKTRPERDEIWRRDFPYTTAGEEQVTRREFARFLVLASTAFAAGTAAIAAWASVRNPPVGEPTAIVPLDDVPVGGSYVFEFPTSNHPAILVRLGEGEEDLVAFSQKCTHLGCTVFHDPDREEFVCPCHEGFFDERTGQVTTGPPELPLPRIELEVRDGTIWALRADPH
jgi:Rieske Fe-S protein